MAWTEVGLGDDEYSEIARELRSNYRSWGEVNDIIMGDVLRSFALESLLTLLAGIPFVGLLLIAPLPDWGYEEAYLRERIARWGGIPRWKHYLNPLRLIGNPIAYLLSFPLRRKLKAAFQRA